MELKASRCRGIWREGAWLGGGVAHRAEIRGRGVVTGKLLSGGCGYVSYFQSLQPAYSHFNVYKGRGNACTALHIDP